MTFTTKISCVLLSLTTLCAVAAPNGEALLKKADEVRNPSDTFKMKATVQTEDGISSYEIFVKGKDKSVIVTKAPAKDAGRNMLMVEKDFYLYMPNLKRSLRMSLAQKLSGQVANGDIARTRWFGDYDVAVESSTAAQSTLLLTGKSSGLTYQKIRLNVATKDGRPLDAQYLSVDGKVVLKKAVFGEFKKLAGAERPSLIKIEDASGKASEIRIESMEKATLPDAFFTQGKLESLR
ncbi:MAG: outer membrane lipoprotein-sorting protein [Bdellovibrionota bacterium]